MLFYVLLIFIGIVIFHVTTRYSRKGILVNKIPGQYPLPIVGNLLYYNTFCPHELWNRLRAVTAKYYPITRVWYISSAVVSIRHPDDIEVLLSSQKAIDKGYAYDHIHPWLKFGLLTSTGDKWRQRRKLLTPAFHFNILKKYLSNINAEAEKSIKALKTEGKEMEKNVVSFSLHLTLNIICEAAMGVKLDEVETKELNTYKKAIHDFGFIVVYRVARPYIFDWMMKPIWSIGRMHTEALKILHNFTNKVIKERKEYHESTGYKYLDYDDSVNCDIDIGRKKKLSMLDLLLAAEKKGLIDSSGIAEEVDTFTFEGHDTTGVALTYTLMLIAENKAAQDRARDEVTKILDRNEGKIEMTDISEFTYLEMCIKESLRLFPSVPTIFRYTAEDLQLKHALIPGGTHLFCNFYDLHRDPNYWSEPDKFDPDRFLPENCRNRHPFAYVPFSAGPRNCIGQKFAMMELKVTIARILYDFYLEPIDRSSDVKLTADLVLRPLNPISVKFIRIQK